jgi:molybdopterin converting factor small subunit
MTIRVHLLGYLAKYSPTGQEKFTLDLSPGATVGALLKGIGFPAETEKMILVNGRQANPAASLAEGDEVFVFSPAAGG